MAFVAHFQVYAVTKFACSCIYTLPYLLQFKHPVPTHSVAVRLIFAD